MKFYILLLSIVFGFNNSFAQEDGDFGDFVPGSEEQIMPYYGKLCANLTNETERAMCSNDQIAEFIKTLKKPAIVDEKKLKTAVVLYFDLTAEGKPVNIAIKKSSGEAVLDNIVLEHFKTMPNWEPLSINGIAFTTENMNIKYTFKPSKK